MVTYRLLELENSPGEYTADGVAYWNGTYCLFYRGGQTLKLGKALTDLGEAEFPFEGGKVFRWSGTREWSESGDFDPFNLLNPALQSTSGAGGGPRYQSVEEIPLPERRLLLEAPDTWDQNTRTLFQNQFETLHRSGQRPYRMLVLALWKRWSATKGFQPPFANFELNLSLLLHARAFGFAGEEEPHLKEDLARHRHLYESLLPKVTEWGARAVLEGNLLAGLHSPVMHAFAFRKEGQVEKVLVVGKGPAAVREKVFSDGLVTAMRVQAGASDLLNEGLICVSRDPEPSSSLNFQAPIMGAVEPLIDSVSTDAAMEEWIRQLKKLEESTGFVVVHFAESDQWKETTSRLLGLAREATSTAEAILWAPSEEAESEAENVSLQPIYDLTGTSRPGERGGIGQLDLYLNHELLDSPAWLRLCSAYEKQLISKLEFDAKIRLEYYEGRLKALEEEKKQWNQSTPDERNIRWGSTMTLTVRFEDATGLTVKLRTPSIVATEKYFAESVPGLIQGYGQWAKKMQDVLDCLRKAVERGDFPFRRLTASRFFDAAIRGVPLAESPEIGTLFKAWSRPMADLIWFEWGRKLRAMGVQPQDVFTSHLTFALFQFTEDSGALQSIRLKPYNVFDAKRSVALLDPRRKVMTVRDAADFPATPPSPPAAPELARELDQALSRNVTAAETAQALRELISKHPEAACRLILEKGGAGNTATDLQEDEVRLKALRLQGENGPAGWSRGINRAETAMISMAVLTAREEIQRLLSIVPATVRAQAERQNDNSGERREDATALSESQLKCRLHLLIAIAECQADDQHFKEALPACYGINRGARKEISDALHAARHADPRFTDEWIQFLIQGDATVAYKRLQRDLPSEHYLASHAEQGSLLGMDAVGLMGAALELQAATATLSHVQETRESALAKLGPAIERAMTANADNVHGELLWLLEVLTGTQVALGKGVL